MSKENRPLLICLITTLVLLVMCMFIIYDLEDTARGYKNAYDHNLKEVDGMEDKINDLIDEKNDLIKIIKSLEEGK